jgi:hypothetical protein
MSSQTLHCRAAGPFSSEEAHRPRVVVGFVALAKVESGADGLERLHVPARPALQRREDGVQDFNPPLQGLVVRAVGDFVKPLNLTSSPETQAADSTTGGPGSRIQVGRRWVYRFLLPEGGRAASGDRGVADGNGEDSGRFFGRWYFSFPDVCPVFLMHERFS